MTPWVALAVAGAMVPLVAWIGYPWAMLRLAQRAPPIPAAGPETDPEWISVLVATREPSAAVRDRLQDLLAGDWPSDRLELIVAVDGDPGAYSFPDLSPAPGRLLVVGRPAGGGKAVALNTGMAAASSEIVVCADTAQRFAPDTLRRLARAVAGGRWSAVSGALTLGNEADPGGPLSRYWRMEKRLREAEARVHSTVGVTGAVYAIRRADWSPLPAGLILDDLWIPMRLVLQGGRVGFDPSAVAYDLRETTPAQEYRRKVRTLTGNLQLVAWLPGVLAPWRNPVWLQFWCHKLLRLATPFALAACAVGIVGAAFAWSPALGAVVTATGILGAVGPCLLPGRIGARIRRSVWWGIAMQGAIVAALWNGVRGRWDVWGRT